MAQQVFGHGIPATTTSGTAYVRAKLLNDHPPAGFAEIKD
jgi:hypothetical protein